MLSPLQIVQGALPVNPSLWPALLLAKPLGEAQRLLVQVYRAWIPGALTAFLQGHSPTKSIRQLDRELGALLVQLPEHLFEVEELPIEDDTLADADAVHRWCWAPHWYLMQDEELLLMEQEAILLEEAHAGCPRQDDARHIVEHAVRDRAYSAIWGASYLAYASSLDPLLDLATRYEARELAAYIARLQRYAAPREVTQEEAAQRTLDLRRCHPSPHLPPEIVARDKHWVIQFDKEGSAPSGRLSIHQETGAMSAALFTLKRKRR